MNPDLGYSIVLYPRDPIDYVFQMIRKSIDTLVEIISFSSLLRRNLYINFRLATGSYPGSAVYIIAQPYNPLMYPYNPLMYLIIDHQQGIRCK